MKKLMIGLVAAALLPVSLSVQAKTICLSISSQTVLLKVGSLAKGTVAPITGVWQPGGGNLPIIGTVVVKHDGTVKYAFEAYSLGTYDDAGARVGINIADKTLAGTGRVDWTGDSLGDADTTATVLNCKDVPAAKTF